MTTVLLLPHLLRASQNNWLSAGTGAGYIHIQDAAVSPLLYGGFQWASELAFLRESKNKRMHARYSYLNGEITTSRTPIMQSAIKRSGMEALLGLEYRINRLSDESRSLFAGASLKAAYFNNNHHQFRNSERQNYLISQVALQLTHLQDIRFMGHAFRFESEVSIPILAFTVRNTFSYPLPERWLRNQGQELSDYIRSGQTFSWPGYAGIGVYTSLTRVLKNGHAIGLGYQWQYSSLMEMNPLKMASHQLILKTMFNF